jgi:1-acyl-sn-glycerol-3-phosphate acyltransferase
MILVAPEATRSPQLQEGKVGVAYLASRTGAPIIPVAIDGTVGFPALRFTARWRQPGAMIRFGRPFRYRLDLRHPGKEQLRLMTDEAMYILARMLPEKRRGVYANLEMASETTIEWL